MNSIDKLVELHGIKQIINVFDLMPDVLFWVKDIQGRIIYGNKLFLQHLGFTSLKQAFGYTDFDFSPFHIAIQFSNDDKKVIKGEEINERLEMNTTSDGQLAWFITSKRAFYDVNNEAIGSYGISRHLDKTSLVLAGRDALKLPVDYIKNNYMEEITLPQLADISCLSISALERRFKKHLNRTPKQFINQIRLENARKQLVETNLPIATIAYNVGFSDHSYFTKQYHLLFGNLPSSLRKTNK
jgi:AraC-like DNA-binding protein